MAHSQVSELSTEHQEIPRERAAGRPLKTAKSVAAATVVKHHNEEGHAKNK